MRDARTAEAGELWAIIHDPNPDVAMAAAMNRNLTVEMAVALAKSRSATPDILGMLASDARFHDSYRLKLAICRNPRSPQRVVFALLRFIRIFDLADLTRHRLLPMPLRQKIEYSIQERIPGMPSGMKISLARRASSNVVMHLIDRGDARVIGACLDSPYLTEAHIYRLVNRPAVKPLAIRLVAEHPKWRLRYSVKFALVRNPKTPLVFSEEAVSALKTADLRILYRDPHLPPETRPFIHCELKSRGESIEEPEDIQYAVDEDEIIPIDGLPEDMDEAGDAVSAGVPASDEEAIEPIEIDEADDGLVLPEGTEIEKQYFIQEGEGVRFEEFGALKKEKKPPVDRDDISGGATQGDR